MDNRYAPPKATVADANTAENTSGQGAGAALPEGVQGWSWGAFFWNWIWAIFNRTWIGLLALIPYVGIVMAIILGVKGREWAWRSKRWQSLEHFNRVQRLWSLWSLVLVLIAVIGVVAAIAIPAYQDYLRRARGY